MVEPLEEYYFKWLCAKVEYNRHPTPSNSHWKLFKALHQIEFVWLLERDSNRAEDGLELRRNFLIDGDIPDNVEWRTAQACSVLEMLIAFSERAEFNTNDSAKSWFWEFMRNLGMDEFNDAHPASEEDIGEIISQLVWRTYDLDGRGGLFPLDNPMHDQRQVEIWYQFFQYLVDQDRML